LCINIGGTSVVIFIVVNAVFLVAFSILGVEPVRGKPRPSGRGRIAAYAAVSKIGQPNPAWVFF
jgi:hypothetical protein